MPSYLTNLLVLTGETHSRQTRYAKFNIACPRVNRNTEVGRTFTVTACREWNKLPLQMRKAETLKTFKNSLWNRIFKDQQSLNRFSLYILWVTVLHANNCFIVLLDFDNFMISSDF